MSITVNRAICLHAKADDLRFLNPVRNRMGKLLGEKSFHVCSFGDRNSEAHARLALKRAEGAFVVIFAHGGSNYIRGGEYFDRISRQILGGEKFLTVDDADVFQGKVIFCLSCDSNGLAGPSLAAGARAFVGFNDVHFNRYAANGTLISDREFEQHAQQLIASAIRVTIERFISGKATLSEAVAFLRLWICQAAVQFVRTNQLFKGGRDVAALLLRVKDGVQYHASVSTPAIRFVK